MYPLIIGIVGHIRAGKSSVAQYLCDEYNYTLASNSGLLRDLAINLELGTNRENLIKLGDSLFTVLGNDALARYWLTQSQMFPIVVDGIRYSEEISLYSQVPSFKLLGIEASNAIRFERLNNLAMEGKDSIMSKIDFNRLKNVRSETQIDELLTQANLIINNNQTKESLFLSIDHIMAQWK